MSTKPASVPTWATDLNYPAGAETYSATPTKVAPTGARRQQGFHPKKKPPAQVYNYDHNLIGQWLQYLSDGDLEGPIHIEGNFFVDNGDIEIDGDLLVMGGTTLDSDVLISGNLELVGAFRHGDRTVTQGFDNAIMVSGAGPFSTSYNGGLESRQEWSLVTSDVVQVPIVAEIIGGVSRVKSISIVLETNTLPNLQVVTYAAGNLSVFASAGTASPSTVTVVDVAMGAFHYRRTMTINSPVVVPLGGRAVVVVSDLSNTEIILTALDVTYDAP